MAFYIAEKTGGAPPITQWPTIIEDPGKPGQKFRSSIFVTLLFFILSSPNIQNFINSIISMFSGSILDEMGYLTGKGYLIIGSIYWVFVVYIYRGI